MRPCIPLPCLQSERGRVSEGATEMPRGEQCDVVFPSNIHKQEQRLLPSQASETGLASCWTPRLIIIWLFTSTTPIGFINGGGGGMPTAEVHKRRTQAPAFMPAGFMSWSARAINKPVVSRCVFTRKGPEKIKVKPQRQTR